jgi:hypothetical protein
LSYFEVQDSSQFRYKIGYVSTELDPHLVSGGLAAGEAARGWVTFEIPADAVLVAVRPAPSLSGTMVNADLRP